MKAYTSELEFLRDEVERCHASMHSQVETLKLLMEAHLELKKKVEQPKPVQVSPLEFVTAVLEKEHLVGKPIMWAQWPNEEKNI